jgi:exopolysaccharide biosynthesis polyprenyl glycosylphosphotransferase
MHRSSVSLGPASTSAPVTQRAAAPQSAAAQGLATSLRRDALFRRLLLAADLVAIVGAFLLTAEAAEQSLKLTWASVLGLAVFAVQAKVLGLYDRDELLLRKTTLDEAPKLFQLATLFTLAAWLAGRLIVDSPVNRREVLFLWLALTIALILARSAARALALGLSAAERCLLIGDDIAETRIRSRFSGHSGVKAEIVAHLDLDNAAPRPSDGFSASRAAEICDLAQTLDVHRVIVAPRGADAEEMLELVSTLKAAGVRVSVLPRLLEVVGSSVEFDDIHGVTVMGVRRFDLTRSSAMIKRASDLVGASLALLLLSPLMIAIAVAIRIDSRGPVFFRQFRVGRRNVGFELVKFRTMVPDAEMLKASLTHRNEARDGLFKIADDPRITRVGKFLRKTALDELPQLFNVLRGEMSLVGPRPLVLEEDERVEGWHRQRLELMPGMTGPWQILGPARASLREMVAIDYLYVANWSLWTDTKILLRTVPYVMRRRGL